MNAIEPTKSLAQVINGSISLNEAIQHTSSSIDIIPANIDLVELESQIVTFDFSKLSYDYILLDCPPNMAGNTVAAILASDGVLVPTTADYYGYKSVKAISESLKTLNRKLNGIIITRYTGRMVISKQVYEDLKELATEIKTKVYNTQIRECVAIRESQLMQQNIFSYNDKSTAALDYMNLVEEISQEES